MASKSSDAERLLNTIVAARVRLSSLRGGTELPHPVASVDAPAHKVVEEPTVDRTIMAPVFPPTPVEHQPDLSRDHVEDSDHDIRIEPSFPAEPLVLGIDPDETEADTTTDSFMDAFQDHRREDPSEQIQHRATMNALSDSAPALSEIDMKEDPFSFIDLIPPEEPPEKNTPPDLEPAQPSGTPPPIRPKPSMPLPTGLAAGAPLDTRTSGSKTDVPSTPVNTRERSSPQIQPPTESPTLSLPKAVEPRLLDPDRSVLEVDVFENEMIDVPNPYPPAAAPKLTESRPIAPSTPPKLEKERSEDDLFDTITEASALLERGDIRTAHTLFSDVLDWIPSHLEARLARGRCSRDLGDTVAAFSDFQRAQMQNPNSPGPHIELGDLFFAKKNYARAISHYDEALSIDPQNALTLCRRGISHHHRKRADKAIDDLSLALRLNPEIPNIERYMRMVQPLARR